MIIFLLVILLIPVIAFFALQNNKIQTYVTHKIAKEISDNLNAKLEIESVSYKFFNRIVLNNVYLEDQLKDTLFFSSKVICNITKLDRKNKKIDIGKVNLKNAKIYLHKFDTLQPMNMRFGREAATETDTLNKPEWHISFKDIKMQNSIFWFRSVRKKEIQAGVINFNDLLCRIEELDIRDLDIKDGIVNFYTKKLKFKEKEGFNVYNVKFHMSIGAQHMVFKNVKIRTPYSYINSDSICFYFNHFDEFQYFAKNIRLDFAMRESNVSFNDIGFFSEIFKNIDLNVVLSGRAYSKLSTFKGKDMKFQIGEQTELITDFNLNGLPNHKQMFMYVDFKKLTTCAKDIEVINKFLKNKKITFPESFNKLGIINYKGNFAGFYDDFVTYGKFTSDLGNISTDLSLKPDANKNMTFSGNLKTNNFQIGELVKGTERIGEISMDAQIKGFTRGNKSFQATTDGVVHSIKINNYNYQNIIIDGTLTEKKYNGYLSISDPNIQLDFSGGIDFSEEIPVFNFNARVPYANLYGLNIDSKDTTSNISFDVDANFKGINMDNAIGEIRFSNAKLTKFNETMPFDTLKLVSNEIADTHRLELRSDYIDASINGIFKSSSLIQSFKNTYFNYLPALINQAQDTSTLINNNSFSLNIAFKKTKIISKFFLPNVVLSDNSFVHADYNAKERKLIFKAFAHELNYNKHTFNDINFNTFSNDSVFNAITDCSSFLLNNYFTLENFKTSSTTRNNNIDLKIDWNNSDVINNEGKILASTTIKQKDPFGDPSFTVTIMPSQVIVKDSLWFINKSIVKIDSTSFTIKEFNINHGDQFFNINGKISENPNDTLYFEFGDLNLAHINTLTKESKLEFEGIINGNANFSNIYTNPLFYSNIEIDNLILNKEEFGYTQIFSRWIDKSKAIQLEASTLSEEKRTVNISGNYYPTDKSIQFNVILDKLGLHVLNPYLNSFASNITGVSDGAVIVTGTLAHPKFNGSLYMQNAAMTIDYIKTRYTFTTEAKVDNNSLVFANVEAHDIYSNTGIVNGYVKFGPNKDISFDFNINANKLLSLNTSYIDNQSFYGTAFTSGIVDINSLKGNTFVNISAKTEKNTKINIPLTHFQGNTDLSFVKFINKSTVNDIKLKEYDIDFSGFGLNFDLEITPDAEAQLIFDSKIGDVIKGKGEGNLTMEIENNDFKMFGEYTIEEGDYLFTLQNVINKRFKIERGGSIVWNGEAYDANIDLEAKYGLKTSLSSLIDSSSSYYANNDYYKKRIPVDCQVYLTNKLMNPDIRFDINLPTADEEAKTLLRTIINTDEKLNKQFLSLIVLNSFLPEQMGTELSNSNSTAGLGTVTTSELLSNQLSHWLSQISDEWDIGVNYRPSDEITKDQIEVALSTQLLNDRISINGNVGYGGQTTEQASDIVGDFNVDVKLTPSGKIRLKAFNESNDKLINKDAPYTQGVGIFYREEFNSFKELFDKFWARFRRKEEEKPVVKTE